MDIEKMLRNVMHDQSLRLFMIDLAFLYLHLSFIFIFTFSISFLSCLGIVDARRMVNDSEPDHQMDTGDAREDHRPGPTGSLQELSHCYLDWGSDEDCPL